MRGLPALTAEGYYYLQQKLADAYHDVSEVHISTASLLNLYDDVLGFIK
jgi:hypothetical protein